MKIARIVLVVLGLGLLGLGGLELLEIKPERYVGILIWFAGAIILHDGILSFAVVGVGIGMRRAGRRFRVPLGVILIVQGALALAALMALIVVPEILKKSIGSANPTVLPLDYGLHLAIFYGVLIVVTGIALAAYLVVAKRRTAAPATA